MDSKAVVDHALFQLTPTRTRCDLVIFAGEKSEKIASGLLEPFISHLKTAKDQISKGGYSITLKPASSSCDSSSWFTKATLERFVRFVSTPEVLERFVSIEREIIQIESSFESNDQANGAEFDFLKIQPKVHHDSSDADDDEKNPKIRLHRVLESRKAMLKKEQAMAYARSLVAGFEMDCLYDLVSFGDAFGAYRLREACINFMELCKKKNEDKIWMDEVAAMRASYLGSSGIVLAAETNNLSQTTSDSITRLGTTDTNEGTENGLSVEFNQQPPQLATWPHHLPQYMQNSQASLFQPYPGYIFPGGMPWPPDSSRRHKSNKKKEKYAKTKSEESMGSDGSGSGSSSSSDERVKTKKQSKNSSSKKVVIRNINYIAPGRNKSNSNSSDEDEYMSPDLLKEQVEAAVGSMRRHHKPKSSKMKNVGSKSTEKGGEFDSEEEKKDGNWDIFQNLLMKDSRSNTMDVGSKTLDVFQEDSSQKVHGEENSSSLHTRGKYASDDFLLTGSSTGNGFGKKEDDRSFQGGESFHGVVKRTDKDDEFLLSSRTAEREYYQENARLDSTEPMVMKTRKDDDFVKLDVHQNAEGYINMDHNMFSGDQAMANRNIRTGENKVDALLDDSFMVQPRTSDGPSQTQPKDDIFLVTDMVGGEQTSNNVPGKSEASHNHYCEPEDLKMMLGHDSVWRNETDYKNDVLLVETVGAHTKGEPSELNIKEGKNGSGKETGRKMSKNEPTSRTPSGSLSRRKSDTPPRSKLSVTANTMNRSKSVTEDEKRKRMEELLMQRQKRIADRSASKGVTVKQSETSKRPPKEIKKNKSVSSPNPNPKPPGQVVKNKNPLKPVMRSSSTNKPSPGGPKTERNKKLTPNIKNSPKATQQPKNVMADVQKKDGKGIKPSVPEKSEKVQVNNGITEEDVGEVKILHTVTSVEKTEVNAVSAEDDMHDKNISERVELMISPQVEQNYSKPSMSNTGERKKLTFSPEISIVNIATTPPESEEAIIHSRKKWNNGESSPKIPKGFRRLLLFGRKT
ncbi:COP1-interacting protein 7 [Striga hermonthica]|uniref:COP1-interacting protein 7 n=1 Tax=Striga hermonthica TaxID=68872 RepID=A0A9N7P3R0_STRHE|nr:COP1-interacting protein 7 [Striga hermonthica]